MTIKNGLVDRCSESLATSGPASVGASLLLSGAITDPFYSQTFALAYGTSAGETRKEIPLSVYEKTHWQSGVGTFDHDSNTVSFQSITASSIGGGPITLSGTATVLVDWVSSLAVLNVEHISPTGTDDQLLINEASRRLAANGGGKIILVDGEYSISAGIEMHPKVWIQGSGMASTRLRVPPGSPVFDVFYFDSTAFGYGANQQGWGVADLMVYAYSTTDIGGANSKTSTYSMQDVRFDEVNWDGFSDLGSSLKAVVEIGDPWGFRMFNCIIEQAGNRPIVRLTGNGASNNGAMMMFNKLKNNDGTNIVMVDCQRCMVTHNELYGNTAGKKNILLDNSSGNIIDSNTCEFGSNDGIHLTSASDGNVLTGNVLQNAAVANTGIEIDPGCSGNIINGGLAIGYATDNLVDNGTNTRIIALYDGAVFIDGPSPFAVEGGLHTATGVTSIDYNVPAGVVEIDVLFSLLSTNNSVNYPRILIGDGGGLETSGYEGCTSIVTGAATITHAASASWPLYDATNWLGGNELSGEVTLTRLSSTSTIWTISGMLSAKSDVSVIVAGAKSLTSELTQLRLTMDGTDEIDAGSMNVHYRR